MRHDIITVLHVTFWSSCATPGLVTRDTATQSHTATIRISRLGPASGGGMVKSIYPVVLI